MNRFIAAPSRRSFLRGSSFLLGSLALPAFAAQARPRYNVASREGRRMLQTFAAGIEILVTRPTDNPRPWFVGGGVHTMDCPHGNWWFHTWHNVLLGQVERNIRAVTGDDAFTIPFWDWTQSPAVPDEMFTGYLDPADPVYDTWFADAATFRKRVGPQVDAFFKSLTPVQAAQLARRGFRSPKDFWKKIEMDGDFAPRSFARAIARDDRKLDGKTARMCSEEVVMAALSRTTPETFASGGGTLSILEGLCHNAIHAAVGGCGTGHRGFMAGGLAPLDPLFFLHHANIDRLWDVWIRKQQASGLAPTYLPDAPFLKDADDGHLFFSDNDGPADRATRIAYDYEPGFGEGLVPGSKSGSHSGFSFGVGVGGSSGGSSGGPVKGGHGGHGSSGGGIGVGVDVGGLWGSGGPGGNVPPKAEREPKRHFDGMVAGDSATIDVPKDVLRNRDKGLLLAKLTLPSPAGPDDERCFDVVVNASAAQSSFDSDSSHYVATLSFFDPMPGMAMPTTFSVPLTLPNLKLDSGDRLTLRIVPRGPGKAALQGARLELW